MRKKLVLMMLMLISMILIMGGNALASSWCTECQAWNGYINDRDYNYHWYLCSVCANSWKESHSMSRTYHGGSYPADCGWDECGVCGKQNGFSHSWEESSRTYATCTSAGSITYRCRNQSSHTYSESYGSANGHSYGSWQTITAATCTTNGSQRRTCNNCSDYQTQTLYATDHNYSSPCKTCGTENVVCSSCGDVKTHTCTFTISYNANGGSEAPDAQTKYPGSDIALSTVIPERTGFIFLGWSTSETATTATYQPGDIYQTDAHLNLYAVWQLIVLEVDMSIPTEGYTYDATAKVPTVSVSKDGNPLTLNTDYTISYVNNVNAGTASVVVTGINEYAGQSVVKTFTINRKNLTITVSPLTKEYGQSDPAYSYSIVGEVTGQTASYTGNISRTAGENVGNYTINNGTFALSDNGTFLAQNYSFTFTQTTFTITIRDINKAAASYQKYWKYTGSSIVPEVTLRDGTRTLVKDTDYTIVYSSNTAIGTATMTITGKGNYTGTKTLSFIINEAGAQYDEIVVDTTAPTISNIIATASGKNIEVAAEIADPASSDGTRGSGVNESATRYAVTTTNQKPEATSSVWQESNMLTSSNAGVLYVWIMAKDNVGNTAISGTTIIKSGEDQYVKFVVDLHAPTITNLAATVNGKVVTIVATLTDPEETNISGSGIDESATRYAVTATNTQPEATSTVWQTSNAVTTTLTGTGYAWIMAKDKVGNTSYSSVAVTLTKSLTEVTISGVNAEYTYTGNEIKPEPVLTTTDGTTLQKGKDYTLTYTSNTNVGTATITIKGEGFYTGTKEITFNIVRANASLSVIPTSVVVNEDGTATVTITYNGDGTLSAVSADTSTATIVLANKVITVTGVKGGTTKITVSASQGANYNVVSSVEVPVTVYGTPSAPTITPSRTTWGNTDVTFTITGATAPQGGQRLQYKIGDNDWENYEGEAVAVSLEGEIEVKARAINESNTSITSSEVSFISKVDKTGPSTTAPTASSTSNTITVECNQEDNLGSSNSGLNTSLTKYKLIAGDGITVLVDWQTSNVFSGLTASTEYNVQTKVTDNAGNESTSEIISIATKERGQATLMLTPTSLTITEGTTGEFTYTYDGDGNVSAVIGSSTIANVVVDTTNHKIRVFGMNVGETTITVTASGTEAFLAASLSASVTVTASTNSKYDEIIIDKTGPNITFTSVTSDENVVTIEVSIEDPDLPDGSEGIGVDTSATRYAVTSTNTEPAESSSSWNTSNVITTSFFGNAYAWVLAKDELGNTTISSTQIKLIQKNYIDENGTYYHSLKDAFEEATSGSVITVVKNVTDSSVASLGSKTFTLNLNEKTITKTTSGITIASGGKLTVLDSVSTAGKIVSTSSTIDNLITNAGELIIQTATITSAGTNAIYSTGSLIIGTLGGNCIATNPIIQGNSYGVNATNGFSFYDGTLKGKTSGYNGIIIAGEPEYSVCAGTDGDYKTAYLAIVDLVAPVGTIQLAGTYYTYKGDDYVNSNTIQVKLTANDNKTATENILVALINEDEYDKTRANSSITWEVFGETESLTKTWESSDGDGRKRVYVIFKDEAGNQTVYFAQ